PTRRPRRARRSEFEPMEPDPQVRLRPAFLLHVDLGGAARAQHRGGAPQGWALGELGAEFLGDPDLARLDVRLDAGRAEHGRAARDHVRAVDRALSRLDLAVVQRDAQPRLARGAIDLVHQMARNLGQQDRIVVHDRDRVAPAYLGGDRLAGPFAHGLFESLTDPG